MSQVPNSSKIIQNQPNLPHNDSQGPISDSKFHLYQQSAQYVKPQKKEQKPAQEDLQEHAKHPHIQEQKNQNQRPINQSLFKNQDPNHHQSKVSEKESYIKAKNNEEELVNNPYTPQDDFTQSKERVKSVQSEEIINSQNSVTEKIASGIVIRIKSLQKVGQNFIPEKIYVQIRNQTNMNSKERESSLSNTKKTKVVNRNSPVWDEDFYYNNNFILDDNITFILRAQNGKQIARRQERNLSRLRLNQGVLDPQGKQIFIQKLKLHLRKKEQDNGQDVATLFIEISFYERQDILGGVIMPNLSLRPGSDFIPKYNAVDKYQPNFSNKLGSKANCFNFFDGQTIPGFDTIEVFPPKFVKKNKHKKVVAAE